MNYPQAPLRVEAEQTILVAHHPPVDGDGRPSYDVSAIDRIARDLFGELSWAPVGPKVRQAFAGVTSSPKLFAEDWLNIINVDAFRLQRDGFLSARPVIGRHSRPDPLKWPDTKEELLQAYPASPDIRVRFLGGSKHLEERVGGYPSNWEVLEFGAADVKAFLGTIDFFVYFHSEKWIEAFGRSILEAIASGAVAILPPSFEPLFGDAAIYCAPSDVTRIVSELHADPAEYARQSARGVAYVSEHFGLDQGWRRVERLLGKPNKTSAPFFEGSKKNKALFLTSNGVGMGHLTRALAVARRLPDDVEPVVVSMSKAFGISAGLGIECDYIPFHRSIGMDRGDWQIALEDEVSELIGYHQPQVFAFDGNVPYSGMLRALDRYPALWKVWFRRSMWSPGVGKSHIEREVAFDAVIEPGEIAGSLDEGLTRSFRAKTVEVAPIRFLHDYEAYSREEARSLLGIGADDIAVLLQLGSENNFSFSGIRAQILERLLPKGIKVVNAEWLIRNEETPSQVGLINLRDFPISKYLDAFDFAISAAGYNTFHENLHAGLPTIFVANENPEQDEQWRRAHFAELRGMALAARTFDPHGLMSAINRLMDENERISIRDACQKEKRENGAAEAARFLADYSYIRR